MSNQLPVNTISPFTQSNNNMRQLGMQLAQSGLQAGASAGNMFLQDYFNRQAEDRNLEDTINLMGLQFGNQLKLNQQGHNLQKKMWDETNYGAQVAHMKKAGLSVGLMYGKGGGSGTTTGSQSGGSASMGQAPQTRPMDIGTMLQSMMLKSQIS